MYGIILRLYIYNIYGDVWIVWRCMAFLPIFTDRTSPDRVAEKASC